MYQLQYGYSHRHALSLVLSSNNGEQMMDCVPDETSTEVVGDFHGQDLCVSEL